MTHAFACICLLLPVQDAVREAPASPHLLPPTTAAYAHLASPVEFVRSVLEHPVHERAKADQSLAKLYASPQMFAMRAGVAMAELGVGMKWPEAVDVLAGEGITLAFDPQTEGAVAILRSGDAEKLPELVRTILRLAGDSRAENNQKGIESGEYRGVPVYRLNEAAMGLLPEAIVITNKKELGQWVIDAALDRPDETFAQTSIYRRALADASKDAAAHAILNLDVIRDLGGVEKLMEESRGNPAAEFLFGGIYENLEHAPFVLIELGLDDRSVSLGARTPHSPEWVSEQREFYFGPEGQGIAPAAIDVDETILNLRTHRDLAGMWRYAGDLFNQEINDGFAQAETTLSTLFAGRDFVEEILAEIQPGWQLIVSRQNFEDVLPKPALRLPSFALVGQFRDASEMNPQLKRIFQSMVGFFNVVGAMEGNPQLDQDITEDNGVRLLSSSFVPVPEDRESVSASIHYNFSPSLALAEKHFVLSSSFELAKRIAAQLDQPGRETDAANLQLTLSADALRSTLADNRNQLVSNNMLEEGATREEAENQIDLLLTVVGWFDEFTASLRPSDDELRLQLRLTLDDPE